MTRYHFLLQFDNNILLQKEKPKSTEGATLSNAILFETRLVTSLQRATVQDTESSTISFVSSQCSSFSSTATSPLNANAQHRTTVGKACFY